MAPACAARYRARNPRATPLYRLFDAHYDEARGQWVFVIPKMLRPYFLHHRELFGGLARTAWETVLELMRAAVGDEDIRPGMVTVVQTAGDLANWHPHGLMDWCHTSH